MNSEHILEQHRDHDTLGGRISRAREALGMETAETAEKIGVTLETYENWESDRDEPRANKLTMIAGVLSVSPSWLLHGIGESPTFENVQEEISSFRQQLDRLREQHETTGNMIDVLAQSLDRLQAMDSGTTAR
ncbi:MAG: helix-turn-helix transcriptional regulator [Rhizobiaceae bacterium]|jgi:transcriptional regulator with XRE-family HTH domain|nr:helix-turn-helix transcriptional regulator [Rhizobiaceae bacterium]